LSWTSDTHIRIARPKPMDMMLDSYTESLPNFVVAESIENV